MTNNNRSFEKLETALVDAGHLINYPKTQTIASQVRTQLSANQSRPLPRLTLALAIVITLVLITLPETRSVFSQFFGLSNSTATPLSTPALSLTARPDPSVSMTWTNAATTQSPTPRPTNVSTPSTLSNSVDIRLLVKPVVHPSRLSPFAK
jgi:hypothetical protein